MQRAEVEDKHGVTQHTHRCFHAIDGSSMNCTTDFLLGVRSVEKIKSSQKALRQVTDPHRTPNYISIFCIENHHFHAKKRLIKHGSLVQVKN